MIAQAKIGLLVGAAMIGAVPPAVILVNGWNSLWPTSHYGDRVAPEPQVPVATADPSAAERLAAGFDAVTHAPDKPGAPPDLGRYAETPLAPPPAVSVQVVATHPTSMRQPAAAPASTQQPGLAKATANPILPPVPPAPERLAAIDPPLALAAVETHVDPAGRAIASDPATPGAGETNTVASLDQPPATLPVPPAPRVPAIAVRADLRKLIADEAAADHVPANLALAVVALESEFKPDKHGDDGKLGLFQLRYSIAKALGYKGSAAGLVEPATNVKWGMKYLSGAYTRAGGDTCKTAMKFIAGHYQEDFKPVHAAYCHKLEDRMAALD